MFRALKWLVGLIVIAVAVAAFWVYSGRYDVAADVPHNPVTAALLAYARERSIEVHAVGIFVPGDLDDPARLRRATGNYDAMCAECHLKPGASASELRRGLYPQPPDFTVADSDDKTPAEQAASDFWVIEHGIKMTAMPAWSQGGVDAESSWDLVALIHALPGLDADSYHELIESGPGHRHAHHDHDDHE